MTQQLQSIIDAAWDNRANISVANAPKEVSDAVEHVISELNKGRLRVATREAVGLTDQHFADLIHPNADGAAVLSAWVKRELDRIGSDTPSRVVRGAAP